MGPSRLTRTGLVIGAVAALAACADNTSPGRFVSPDASLAAISTPGDGVADHEFFEVCKVYTEGSGPAVTVDVFDGTATTQATLASGECENVYISGPTRNITVTENVPAGYTASYVKSTIVSGVTTTDPSVPGNSASGNIGGAPPTGVLVTFTNTLIPDEDEGCTYTQGYWKTHSIHGPAGPPDDGWDNVGGPDTDFYLSGFTWLELFNEPVKGRKYVQLAHQYMAAKLNVLNGASSTPAVDAAITAAETFFATASITDTPPAGLAGTLGSFNEGLIGPGHCDDEVTS